ncbi:MAG: MerR family transcriptional regulator [Gammaproteobacteria bacterium]|nr:MerR family transcriptional regulator [Gammaproteobacteria bacterium]
MAASFDLTSKDSTPDSTPRLVRFPIRVLAEKTGIGTSTLRAWEKRYGLLKPERTPKGHRLYGLSDIKRVQKIIDLLNDGHTLPKIADLLSAEGSTTGEISASGDIPELASVWERFTQSTLEAVSDFSIERIDAIYNEASSLYPIDLVTDQLIKPTLAALGETWKQHPERGIAEEHFYSSWLKSRLGARFHHANSQAHGARIVCACMPGSYHEVGLMLFSLSALARGYRVLYFGADLPLSQIPYIARRSAAKAIVLSAPSHDNQQTSNDLAALIPSLDTPVFIGGPSEHIDTGLIEGAGGILLGQSTSVALRVLEGHVPAY